MADTNYGAMGGAAIEGALSLIGSAVAQGDYGRAMQLYQQALQGMSSVDIPAFQKLAAPLVGSSNAVGINSEGRSAQSRALSRLQQLGAEGGMDAQARLAQQEALSASDQNAKGNREALQQSYARRGMQNSGAEMEAQLANASNSANSARDASLSASAEARNRALSALKGSAEVGGQMRGQDIGIEQGNQNAENARNQFNAKMTSATDQYNGDANLQNALARLKRAQMIGQSQQNMAGMNTARGNRTAGDFASVGRFGNNIAQMYNEDGTKKTTSKDATIDPWDQ